MKVAPSGGASNDVELRRIEADLEIRRAELEEKKAQRLADEKQSSTNAELKKLEIDNLAGRGIRFTGAQATVAAAAIALLSGVAGGVIQAWQSGTVEQIKAAGLVAVEQNKSDASIKIEQRKSDANIELEKLKFVTSLVAKATETPNRDEQIRNLQFYVNAGFIDEPYATKIRAIELHPVPKTPS